MLARFSVTKAMELHGHHIGHGIHLSMAPKKFDRVEFGGIEMHEGEMKTGIGEGQHLEFAGTMELESVPRNQNMVPELLEEASKEGHRPWAMTTHMDSAHSVA